MKKEIDIMFPVEGTFEEEYIIQTGLFSRVGIGINQCESLGCFKLKNKRQRCWRVWADEETLSMLVLAVASVISKPRLIP